MPINSGYGGAGGSSVIQDGSIGADKLAPGLVLGTGGTDTAAQVLAKLITVDGEGSGVDTDIFRGTAIKDFLRSFGNITSLNDTGLQGGFHTFLASATGNPTSAGGILLVVQTIREDSDRDVAHFVFANDNSVWTRFAGSGGAPGFTAFGRHTLSATEIKVLYEALPDTNAFTDSEQTKLDTLTSIGLTQNLDALDKNITLVSLLDATIMTPASFRTDNGFSTGCVVARGKALAIGVTEVGSISADNTSFVALYSYNSSTTDGNITRIETNDILDTTGGITIDGTAYNLNYIGFNESEIFLNGFSHLYEVLGRVTGFIDTTPTTIQFKKPGNGGFWHWGALSTIDLGANVHIDTSLVSSLNNIDRTQVNYFAGGAFGSPSEDTDGEALTMEGAGSHASQLFITGDGDVAVRSKRDAVSYGTTYHVVTDKNTFKSALMTYPTALDFTIPHGLSDIPVEIWINFVSAAPTNIVHPSQANGVAYPFFSVASNSRATGYLLYADATNIRFTYTSTDLKLPLNELNWRIQFNARL